jgi:serine/threonine-protein kinase
LLIGCIVIFLIGKAFGVFNFGAAGTEQEAESETEQVEMIRVVGMDVDEAKRALLELGLTPEIQYEANSAYEAGTVLRASVQDGLMVDKGTNIVLTVAQSEEGITVPGVTGKSQTEATSILEKEGFVVNVTESYDASVESGYVISQSPEEGTTAPEGSSITIRVSQGAESDKVRVPNVVGLTEEDAMASLTESGLSLGTVTQVSNEDASLTDLVCYQSYSVGSYVDKGTAIDLKISTGPSQVTYRYSEGITAPTEDEDYRSGMTVTVTVTTADGTQLLSTQTSSFPVAVNYTGIKSATGTITFTFTVQTEDTTTTDPDTGETVTTPGTSTVKTVTRAINFTQE